MEYCGAERAVAIPAAGRASCERPAREDPRLRRRRTSAAASSVVCRRPRRAISRLPWKRSVRKRRTAWGLEGDGQGVPGVPRRQSAYTSVCLVDPSHAEHMSRFVIHRSPHLRHLCSLPPYMFEVMMKPMPMISKLPVWSAGAWMLERLTIVLMCLEFWTEAPLRLAIDMTLLVTVTPTMARGRVSAAQPSCLLERTPVEGIS